MDPTMMPPGMDPMAGGMMGPPPLPTAAPPTPPQGDPISHLLMALQLMLGNGGMMPGAAPMGPPPAPIDLAAGAGPMPPY